jgi:hypothetical protein
VNGENALRKTAEPLVAEFYATTRPLQTRVVSEVSVYATSRLG